MLPVKARLAASRLDGAGGVYNAISAALTQGNTQEVFRVAHDADEVIQAQKRELTLTRLSTLPRSKL